MTATHIVDVNKGIVETCPICRTTPKNKCGKKCKEHTFCIDINRERLRNVIYQSKDYLSLYGQYVVDINNYGYSAEDFCCKKVSKIRLLHDILEEKYVSLLHNQAECLCDEDIEKLVQKALVELPIRCKRVRSLDFVSMDKSGLEDWIIKNPNLVAFEKWEKALHKFKFDFTFDIKPIECKFVYDFEVKKIDCNIVAAIEAVQKSNCEIKALFETRQEKCTLLADFEINKKECEINYEVLIEQVKGCDITFDYYLDLVKCGLSYDTILTLTKCEISVIPTLHELLLEFKNGDVIDADGFDVQVLDKILNKNKQCIM